MNRNFWVWLHRWTGLTMAGFLIVVGLTGSVLAFLPEMNRLLLPSLFPGPHEGATLGLAEIVKRAEATAPQARATGVVLAQPGTARVAVEPRSLPLVPDYSQIVADPLTGDEYAVGTKVEPAPLGFDFMFLDQVSGAELGRLEKDPPLTSAAGIMPFLLSLHVRLAMGEWGGWILGIIALIWTLDCFVGGYLTLPVSAGKTSKKSYLERWKPSWLVKLRGSFYRVNFDLHRAFGLWLFAVLLLFGWSSVYFNMRDVYTPVMMAVSDFDPPMKMNHNKADAKSGSAAMGMAGMSGMGKKARREPKEAMSWDAAQATGERLMAEQAAANGFTIERATRLVHQAAGTFTYNVHSSRDIGEKGGRTSVVFDAVSGELRSFRAPTGQHAGNTFTTWIVEMHLANLFGFWFQIFVCVLGIGIAMLSVTGVYIWWKKRAARIASAATRAAPQKTAGSGAPAPAMAFLSKSFFDKSQ